MKEEFLDLYRRVSALHRELVSMVVDLETSAKQTADLKELADLAMVLRDSGKLTKDMDVQVKNFESLVAKIFTAIWGIDPDAAAAIETEWCTCTPDIKIRAQLPKMKDDPERYKSIMLQLGLPAQMVESGLFRLGWDEFSEHLTQLKREGKPFPEEVEKAWVEHTLKIRARRKLAKVLTGARLNELVAEENDDDGTFDDVEF